MASGDILLEIRDSEQHTRLNKLVAFGETPVTVSAHRSMNTARGVVSDSDLIYLSEAELLEGWKGQNVTNVQRIVIRRENKEIPTKHLILTFNSSDLPQTIETGYTKTPVRPYIPNPRRCFQCQRFGHGSRSCRGRPTCAKCGAQGHDSDNCDAAPHCVNCDGAHAAYSRSCPNWKKEKEIISLKVRENISFREARKRCSPFHTNTYADAARKGAAPHQPLPHQRPASSEPLAMAPAPVVAVAKAAPPTQPQSLATPGSSSLKTSPRQARSPTRTKGPRPRASSASQEVMETTPALPGPKDRRGFQDRARKAKKPVTGPDDGLAT
ncbi:uncharacterized protein LOC119391444 [Rhipicephalus sanguineus]|uniref:uncharacterized protein LOC119391444 n=1 Tax=Rhipicephalus sanguineus TaxID=34632 RepID=UPI001893B493|nr:uncharacterized protein LOC119391444 [Rhipicephalus sanguineus]